MKRAGPKALITRERQHQAALMRRIRAAGRDLTIPPAVNDRRRRQCRTRPARFLRAYLGERWFTREFTADQRDRIDQTVRRMKQGGWLADAAPRGDGKTTITLGLTVWGICYGVVRFPVFISATGPDATFRRDDIKRAFETNDELAADFPEIATPIRALEGSAQRANAQTVNGRRTHLVWTGEVLIFPTVDGSPASGTILVCRGIESSIRGLNVGGRRPDFVFLDDVETRESVRSPSETAQRKRTIDDDITGLGGTGRRIAMVYACTLTTADCLAAQYTDREKNPAWSGIRRRLMTRRPRREDLWNQYIEQRQRDALGGDETGRTAHGFYLAHRAAMDRGARISNPWRYDDRVLPDGSAAEVSALQHCYNIIADAATGWDHFAAEYQNEPPREEVPETTDLSARDVQRRTNDLPRGVCPAGTEAITAGVDVAGRALHWTVAAWVKGRGHVIDYGTMRVASPLVGRLLDEANVEATANAIVDALCELREAFAGGWPEQETTDLLYLDVGLVDAGWGAMDSAVYAFTTSGPRGLWRPSKGFGTSSGQARYRAPATPGKGRRVGAHWHATFQARPACWLYNLDADAWKSYVHGGFQVPAGKVGALTVFGSDAAVHRLYAQQILAEVLTRAWQPGKGFRTWWDQRHRENHWLDATAMACAAAEIAGLRIVAGAAPPPAGADRPGRRRRPGRTAADRAAKLAALKARRAQGLI